MKNKNIKNKPQKCGGWLVLHSRFPQYSGGGPPDLPYKRNTSIKPSKSFFKITTAKGKKEPESPPPLKQFTGNLSLGDTEIEKTEEGAGARSFLCDV